MYGKIMEVNDQDMVVEIATGVQVKVTKAAIANVVEATPAESTVETK
jgi:preprotein translocase subunit YajC